MPAKPAQRRKKPSQPFSKQNETFWSLLFMALGILTALCIRTDSMGILGALLRTVTLALFSKLALLLALLLTAYAIYTLIFPSKVRLQKLPWHVIASLLGSLLLAFGLLHADSVLALPPWRRLALENTLRQASQGEGAGLISSFVTYYLVKLIGTAGSALVAFVLASYGLTAWLRPDPQKLAKGLRRLPGLLGTKLQEGIEALKNFVWVESEESESQIPTPSWPERIRGHFRKTEEEKKPTDKALGEGSNQTFAWIGNSSNPAPSRETSESSVSAAVAKDSFVSADLFKEVHSKDPASALAAPASEQNVLNSAAGYQFPGLELLKRYPPKNTAGHPENRDQNARLLESTLLTFAVEAKVRHISVGPTLVRYELEVRPGTKVSKITNLTEDLALALAAQSIRIEAPIPGKPLIGIEVPRPEPEMVSFYDLAKSEAFKSSAWQIGFGLGKDISGSILMADIAKMPHMLIAGSTGSGKSVCINTLICSLLYRYSPQEVRLILIDPKMVELSIYNGIAHLLVPVVTDMKKAPAAFNWAVAEMNRRYQLFAKSKVKDLGGYNEKYPEEPLPRIVLIVDELADLMLVAPSEIEDAICRLAQMARACGMHLVIATQRPSVDVITGLIKANIPSRIAFAVSSQTDSRTILDMGGAEKLLGRGDMLYYPIGASKPQRAQGAFITEGEVERITDFLRQNASSPDPQEQEKVLEEMEKIVQTAQSEEDPLLEEVIEVVTRSGVASTSMLQRHFKVGYNRATQIMSQLEERGIVGPNEGTKPRKVLIQAGAETFRPAR